MRRRRSVHAGITAILFLTVGILAGCKSSKSTPQVNAPQPAQDNTSVQVEAAPAASEPEQGEARPVKISRQARAIAAKIFAHKCASCHGADYRGNGPAYKRKDPKPRNFHDRAWQKSVTDEHIAQTIIYGGSAVGLPPQMPSNPELANRPDIVAALVQNVREVGRK